MNFLSHNLSRWILLAQSDVPHDFHHLEFGRIKSNVDWILPVGMFLAIAFFVRFTYKRDSVELPKVIGWILAGLRTAAFLGLLLIYLQPQWPNEIKRIENSRVLLLVDTSQSMRYGLDEAGSGAGPKRFEAVQNLISKGDFIQNLRKVHDVVVLSFSDDAQDPRQLATLPKLEEGKPDPLAEVKLDLSESDATDDSTKPDSETAGGKSDDKKSADKKSDGEKSSDKSAGQATSAATRIDAKYWEDRLKPIGAETRLGQALRKLVTDERGKPVAGIVIFSDFGQNAGIDPEVATKLASRTENKIRFFTVGLGSDRLPPNVAVELHAPDRAYPNNPFTIEARVQARGMAGESVPLELTSTGIATAERPDVEPDEVYNEEALLGEDGKTVAVKFVVQASKPGRRKFKLKAKVPPGDEIAKDNEREAEIEILDGKSRVLLLAGGPLREYHFVRNLLHRAKENEVDVFLQSARGNISQEANKILNEFPSTKQELYTYDCIIAFDPDWVALGAARCELIADWVAKEAGGLIVIAGPVQTRRWTQNPDMNAMRELYPVEFHRSFAGLDDFDGGDYGATEPSQLVFTQFGKQAEFLYLEDTASASAQAWHDFPGVYGYYTVRRPSTSGATVYTHISDTKGRPEEERVYMAAQYFGQGRVFYMGSGEMWRLRAQDEGEHERLWPNLVQHVTSGRLSRNSGRGEILVDSSRYTLGSTVYVTARLRDEKREDLIAPSVRLDITTNESPVPESVDLKSDPDDPNARGRFKGEFTVRNEGEYFLSITLPGASDVTIKRPPIEVTLPDLERDNRQRNDALLKGLAQETDGVWYLGTEQVLKGAPGTLASAAADAEKKDEAKDDAKESEAKEGEKDENEKKDADEEPGKKTDADKKTEAGKLVNAKSNGPKPPLVKVLEDKTRTITDPDTPTRLWNDERWSMWAMYAICGLLALEWLIRRVSKLA